MFLRKAVQYSGLVLFIFLAGFLVVSCASTYEASYDVASEEAAWSEPAMDDRGDYGADFYDTETPLSAAPAPEKIEAGQVGQAGPRRIIRNGSIELTVNDTRETLAEIRKMTTAANGIISDTYIYEARENLYFGNVVVRVPEQRFDDFMAELEELGKAANIQTSQQDVTMQYVDLESRLKNQQAQETRLVEILDMAENVEEVLEVERELYRVRGEIESMTAQFTHLADQVAYSTVSISLREEFIPTEVISQGPFEDFGRRVKQTMIGSINFVLNAISVIMFVAIALVPVALALALPALVIWLIIRKRIAKRKLPQNNFSQTWPAEDQAGSDRQDPGQDPGQE